MYTSGVEAARLIYLYNQKVYLLSRRKKNQSVQFKMNTGDTTHAPLQVLSVLGDVSALIITHYFMFIMYDPDCLQR